jgi:hypothetical protein
MSEKKHIQYKDFTLDYEGDTLYFSIPSDTFQKLRHIAWTKGIKMSYLICEAIDKSNGAPLDKVIGDIQYGS